MFTISHLHPSLISRPNKGLHSGKLQCGSKISDMGESDKYISLFDSGKKFYNTEPERPNRVIEKR
jgi:hypothetical protein